MLHHLEHIIEGQGSTAKSTNYFWIQRVKDTNTSKDVLHMLHMNLIVKPKIHLKFMNVKTN